MKIGFTMALTTPKINATTNRVTTLRPVVGAVRVMPLNSHVATASAAMLASDPEKKPHGLILHVASDCQDPVDP